MFGWFKKKKPIEDTQNNEEKPVKVVESSEIISIEQPETIPAETPNEPLAEPTISEEAKKGLFEGLKRSSARIGDGITSIFTKAKLDEEALEELEELLGSNSHLNVDKMNSKIQDVFLNDYVPPDTVFH